MGPEGTKVTYLIPLVVSTLPNSLKNESSGDGHPTSSITTNKQKQLSSFQYEQGGWPSPCGPFTSGLGSFLRSIVTSQMGEGFCPLSVCLPDPVCIVGHGHVGHVGHVGHIGHIGHVGHVGKFVQVGNVGNFGHISHVGHIGKVHQVGYGRLETLKQLLKEFKT